MKEVTMSSKKNEIPPPPGFPRPLAEISPTGNIIMHDHKCKAGERTFLDKRCNLRQRDPQNISVPTHSHISPRAHNQGLRRGPGRPRKNRSDDVVFISMTTKESLASEPLRRGPGRPWRKRSVEDGGGIQQKREMAKEKKITLKRQIEDLKTEVAQIDHEEERLKHDEIKYKEAHEAAKAKMQELGTQLEEGQAKLRDIERRKNAALRGIESITQRLKSRYPDDLD